MEVIGGATGIIFEDTEGKVGELRESGTVAVVVACCCCWGCCASCVCVDCSLIVCG